MSITGAPDGPPDTRRRLGRRRARGHDRVPGHPARARCAASGPARARASTSRCSRACSPPLAVPRLRVPRSPASGPGPPRQPPSQPRAVRDLRGRRRPRHRRRRQRVPLARRSAPPLERPELAADAALRDQRAARRNYDALRATARADAAARGPSRNGWRCSRTAGVPCGRVRTVPEALESAAGRGARTAPRRESPRAGARPLRGQPHPPRRRRRAARLRPPPLLGRAHGGGPVRVGLGAAELAALPREASDMNPS